MRTAIIVPTPPNIIPRISCRMMFGGMRRIEETLIFIKCQEQSGLCKWLYYYSRESILPLSVFENLFLFELQVDCFRILS